MSCNAWQSDGRIYATISAAPVDYDGTNLDFVFDADNSIHCVNVSIVDDEILEDTENFFGTLTTTDSAVLLIPDEAEVEIIEDPDEGENNNHIHFMECLLQM